MSAPGCGSRCRARAARCESMWHGACEISGWCCRRVGSRRGRAACNCQLRRDHVTARQDKPMTTDEPITAEFSPALTVTAFGITDRGAVRQTNEDQFLIAELSKSMRVWQTSLPEPKVQVGEERAHLFLVADGMGGHQAGERASAIAARRCAWCMPVTAARICIGIAICINSLRTTRWWLSWCGRVPSARTRSPHIPFATSSPTSLAGRRRASRWKPARLTWGRRSRRRGRLQPSSRRPRNSRGWSVRRSIQWRRSRGTMPAWQAPAGGRSRYFAAVIDSTRIVRVFSSKVPVTLTFWPANRSAAF